MSRRNHRRDLIHKLRWCYRRLERTYGGVAVQMFWFEMVRHYEKQLRRNGVEIDDWKVT